MTLRRDIRKAIQRGTSIHATVEEYSLGYATVRLATNGTRLTNLSTQGAIVKKDDKVIIDYSAGVKPVVRPLFIPEYEEEELQLDEGKEVIVPDDDWSCMAAADYENGYGLDPDGNDPTPSDCWHQFIPMATWTRMRMADGWWYAPWGPGGIYGSTAEFWDTAEGAEGMFDETSNFGHDHFIITRTGRYWIHGRCEFDDIDGNRTTGVPVPPDYPGDTWYLGNYPEHPVTGVPRTPYNHDGHFKIRITKNDVPVAMLTYRSCEGLSQTQGGLDGPYTSINALVWCEVGDIIALEMWENNNGPYMNPGWGFPMSGTAYGNILSATLVPGSERATYQATDSQSAYMSAHSLQQAAYTIGTIDGDNWKIPAYLCGGLQAGGEDQQGNPPWGSYIHACLEGDSGAGGGDSEGSQNCYLSGN